MKKRMDDDLNFLDDEPKGNLLVILGCVAHVSGNYRALYSDLAAFAQR